jgi:hypothetical protein
MAGGGLRRRLLEQGHRPLVALGHAIALVIAQAQLKQRLRLASASPWAAPATY